MEVKSLSMIRNLTQFIKSHFGFTLPVSAHLRTVIVHLKTPTIATNLSDRTLDFPGRPNIPQVFKLQKGFDQRHKKISTENSYSGPRLISGPTLVSQKLKARSLISDISKLSKRGDASQKESRTACEKFRFQATPSWF